MAQSIEAFNDSIAQYNAFKMSDPVLYVNVEKKLEAARKERFPNGLRRRITRPSDRVPQFWSSTRRRGNGLALRVWAALMGAAVIAFGSKAITRAVCHAP